MRRPRPPPGLLVSSQTAARVQRVAGVGGELGARAGEAREVAVRPALVAQQRARLVDGASTSQVSVGDHAVAPGAGEHAAHGESGPSRGCSARGGRSSRRTRARRDRVHEEPVAVRRGAEAADRRVAAARSRGGPASTGSPQPAAASAASTRPSFAPACTVTVIAASSSSADRVQALGPEQRPAVGDHEVVARVPLGADRSRCPSMGRLLHRGDDVGGRLGQVDLRAGSRPEPRRRRCATSP